MLPEKWHLVMSPAAWDLLPLSGSPKPAPFWVTVMAVVTIMVAVATRGFPRAGTLVSARRKDAPLHCVLIA